MAAVLASSLGDVVVDPNARDIDNMNYEQLLEMQEEVGEVSKGLSKQ
jgi:hypothetical protein